MLETLAPPELLHGDAEQERRVRTVLTFWLIAGVPWPLIFSLVYGALLHCWPGAMVCGLSSLALVFVPTVLRATRSPALAGHMILGLMVSTLAVLAALTGGVQAPALLWLAGAPLVALFVAGLRAGLAWTAGSLLVIGGFLAWDLAGGKVLQLLTHHGLELLTVTGLGGLILLIATLSATYELQRRRAVAEAAERERQLEVAIRCAERHAAELARSSAALRISEERLRTIFDVSTAGIFITDAVGRIALANRRMAELFECELERLVGREYLSLVHLDQREEARAHVLKLLSGAILGVASVERRLLRPDGTEFWGLVSARHLAAQGHFAGGLVGTIADITSQKRAEAALRASESQIALQAGRAEVATDVLHNVGNVLNSINVSAALLDEKLRQSEVPVVRRLAEMLDAHRDDLAAFLATDARGSKLPAFVRQLADLLAAEHAFMRSELQSLAEAVEHIRFIISTQQVHARNQGLVEHVEPVAVMEQALGMTAASLRQRKVDVVKTFEPIEPVPLYRHKILQILVNLLTNARHALEGHREPRMELTVARVTTRQGERLRFRVADNGVGIAAENLERIFRFGFSTRRDGHGYGLHGSANLAREMGGELRAASDGPGQGAVFTLDVPVVHESAPSR